MEIEDFVSKNKLKVSKKTVNLYKTAQKIMNESEDLMHAEAHVQRILKDLDRLLNSPIGVSKVKVDFEVLLPAIAWHDTWKAKNAITGIPSFAYAVVYEGIGSKNIFSTEAFRRNISDKQTQKISYAIRKHSSIQFTKRNTIEAQILWDLDTLEEISKERVEQSKKTYFVFKKRINLRMLKIYMRYKKQTNFYYKWTQKIYGKQLAEYMKKINLLMDELKKS